MIFLANWLETAKIYRLITPLIMQLPLLSQSLRLPFSAVLYSVTLLSASLASETRSFDDSWLFHLEDHGEAAAMPEFNDSKWQSVRLPHDWAITGAFDPSVDGYAGKLPWQGVGWYRKSFKLDENDSGKRVYFDFGAVMAHSRVFINGHLAGSWDYGYTSFRMDATPYVRFDAPNLIAVETDTRKWGTRWYPGAGIYRSVSMVLEDPVHFSHWGTFVRSEAIEGQPDSHRVTISSTITNHTGQNEVAQVMITATSPNGQIVQRLSTALPVYASTDNTLDHSFSLKQPELWDIDNPALYHLEMRLSTASGSVSSIQIPFGIRTVRFDPDDGFHLNGRRVQIKGVNLHHDLGPLGAAFNPRAAERQLEIMRDMGINALRTSHNPPAAEVLDMCDRMGILVWNEVFDKWDATAGRHDGQPPLKEFGDRHIRATVLRDRNHPCVITWSVGNEILPGGADGVTPERTASMVESVRRYDTSRPVSMGCHIPAMVDDANFDALDMTGWNYARRYLAFRSKYPDKPILYSESASALSTRGHYELPLPQRPTDRSESLQVCSYDLNAADWSDIADAEFKLMETDSYVGGEFVWTGFDYIGEPTPYSPQARSSYFGIVDLCGFPKDRFYLYRSYWRPDTPTVHILPHWNWPDRVGQNVPVFVYTNGDSAELFLNGRSLGIKRKGEVPDRSPNLAGQGIAQASSAAPDHPAQSAIDENTTSCWKPDPEDSQSWLEVGFEEPRSIGFLAIDFEKEEKLFSYAIQVEDANGEFQTLLEKPTSDAPMWGGPKRIFHSIEATTKRIRIQLGETKDSATPAIRSFAVYEHPVENDYYDVTYHYRLRWNDVVYEPGELKAVAYKDGNAIGEAIVRTASEPASIRLTPDRTTLQANGIDLSFITVEVLDAEGNPCPLADNRIDFKLDGLDLAGVGNGNPLSLEPFKEPYRKLFNGKALLIARSRNGESGTAAIQATAEGLQSARLELDVIHPL